MNRPAAVLVTLVVTVAAWLGPAPAPAGAAAARPGDERTVLTVVPAGIEAVHATDDGVLTVTAAPGHRVVVLDYAGAPWHELDGGESVTWHDHRAHWMGDGPGTPGGQPGVIAAVRIPVVVDGRPAAIEGELRRVREPVGWVPLLIGVALLLAVVLAGRRSPLVAASAAVAVASVGALLVTVYGVAAVGASTVGVIVPLLAALSFTAAAVAVAAHSEDGRAGAVLVGAALLTGWAVNRLPVIWHAVGTTDLPLVVERAAVAGVSGLAVGAAVLTVWSGHPRLRAGSTARGAGGPDRSARAAAPG